MLAYSGGRSCAALYEGVTTLEEAIERLKSQCNEFQQMKEAGIKKVEFDGEELAVHTVDPQVATKFGLKENPHFELVKDRDLVLIEEDYYVDDEDEDAPIRFRVVEYLGSLELDNPYEEVTSIESLIARLKCDLTKLRKMKASGIRFLDVEGEVMVIASNATAGLEFGCERTEREYNEATEEWHSVET